MSVYLREIDDIYFPKTREYFQEVISSYSNGNYRSAVVMLYSVAICDILFKLQELKDMFNDTVADEILKEVEKCRNEHDNKSKSRWEKELIDNVYKKTKLLDLEAYTNLNHLFDHRNFSAHPALNEDYELIAPSKETTIAHIRNILHDILIKPPIFIKNITHTLTEDLKEKKELYREEYEKLSIYLNNKYFSKMPISMKKATFKAFWKFCFCLPDDEDCISNLGINRSALSVLMESAEHELAEYIKTESHLFSVAVDDSCSFNLTIFLSEFPYLYSCLSQDVKLAIDAVIQKDSRAKAICWFKYDTDEEHLTYLKGVVGLSLEKRAISRLTKHYKEIGKIRQLVDFFIEYYGKSGNFDTADNRFKKVIEPFVKEMNHDQFVRLIEVSNSNRQVYGRGASYSANGVIVTAAKDVLGADFDYSEYSNFRFDNSIIAPEAETAANDTGNSDWT